MTETIPEQPEVQAPKIIAAAVFGFDTTGAPFLNLAKDSLSIETDREMNLIEIRRYMSEILMDLQAQTAAEYTIARLVNVANPQPAAEPVSETTEATEN